MGSIADGILHLPPWLALTLVFALPLLEASAFVGFLIPGETGVLLGGVLVNQGKLGLTAVLVLGIAGAVIGDSIGYEVGRKYGVRLLTWAPDWIVDDEKLDKAQGLMRRLGGKAVFIGRFTVAARVLVPGLAGMSRLPYPRFLAFNVTGGVLWASAFVLLGYAVGSQYKTVQHNASLVGFGILLLVAAYALYRYLKHRRGALAGSDDAHAGASSDSRG